MPLYIMYMAVGAVIRARDLRSSPVIVDAFREVSRLYAMLAGADIVFFVLFLVSLVYVCYLATHPYHMGGAQLNGYDSNKLNKHERFLGQNKDVC